MKNEAKKGNVGFGNGYINWLKDETHFFSMKRISRFWTIGIGIAFFTLLSMGGGGSFSESVTGTTIWALVLTVIAYAWQRNKENKTKK